MSHYTRYEVGAPSAWSALEYAHPQLARPVRGKFFLTEALALTGLEISVNSMPPKAAVPFLHTHREHEELYIFLSGQGEFQVDDEHFLVEAGSAVRVAPAGRRCWRNTGAEPLTFVVIQGKAGSLAGKTIDDGVVCAQAPAW